MSRERKKRRHIPRLSRGACDHCVGDDKRWLAQLSLAFCFACSSVYISMLTFLSIVQD